MDNAMSRDTGLGFSHPVTVSQTLLWYPDLYLLQHQSPQEEEEEQEEQ